MSYPMSGSALPRPRHLKLLLVATLAAVVAPNAAAADSRQGAFLPELWGVAGNASFRTPTFARLRRGGINTVVIDSRRLRPRQVRRLTRAAGKARLRVVRPTFLARPSTVDDARTACDVFRNAHHGSACALWESSVSSALTLAQSGAADLVVVHLARPGALRALAGSSAGRILAIVSLGQHFRARTWRSLIQVASSSATLDLAFAPRRARQKTVSGYLKLLDKSRVTTPDRRAPTSPLGLKIAQQTQTTLGLSWGAVVRQAWRRRLRRLRRRSLAWTYDVDCLRAPQSPLRYVTHHRGERVRCRRKPLRRQFAPRRNQSL